MTRFAVFGGSFDPPHVGHVLAVHYVLSVGWVEGVVIVPVYSHAFAKKSAPFDTRLRFCRAAFGDIGGVEISDIERDLPEPSYTLRTVRALAQRHPERSWRLLMGSDLLEDAKRWHRFDELCELAPPLVLTRVGHQQRGDAPAVLPEVSSSRLRQLLSQAPTRKWEQADWSELGALIPRAVRELIEAEGTYR